jgi:hypothetical protein
MIGTELQVDKGSITVGARVVEKPFYDSKKGIANS